MLLSHFRQAARTLARTPSFTLLAIGTLALGIGANTAIFSAVYRLHFAPLPFEAADRLLNLARTRAEEGFFLSPSPRVVAAWQEHAETLEQVAFLVQEQETLTGAGEPVELANGKVPHQLFEMLSVPPLIGRSIRPEDIQQKAAVVLLSEHVWRDRFGADPGVLGRTVQLGGRPLTVIGVMPARFARFRYPYPRDDLWTPHTATPTDFGMAMGLMKATANPEQVSAELERIATNVETEDSPQEAWSYRAMPLPEMLAMGSRRILPVLLGAVALVLLIACANVASLMIVRLNSRRREIAIRAALGAGARRILASVVAEQLLLALAAGAAGLLLAAWTMDLIARFQPQGMPLLDTLALDPAVLLFAGTLLCVSVAMSGVLPAWAALRRDPADVLRAGGERVTGGSRTRSILVSAQIALSVVLLVGAVVLIRSYASLISRDLGFDPRNRLAVVLALPETRYTPEQRASFFESLLESVRTAPGVTQAAVGGGTPPHLGLLFATLTVDASEVSPENTSYVAGTSSAPGFLPALGVSFIEGRDFTSRDARMEAIIVNRAFVERFWPGQSGVGKRIKISQAPEAPWIEIIAVIENVRMQHGTSDDLQLFYPIEWMYPEHTLLLRTDGADPLASLPFVRQAVARLDPALAVREAATLQQRMSDSLSRERFVMLLLAVFAALALALTVVGLYGLVAYSVQQRVREIGIRVALGATTRAVRELFIAHGMRLVAVGLIVGVLGATAAVSVLRSLVHGVAVYDGVSFAAAIGLIAPAALLASWLPARRAARVDPIITLKAE